MFRVIALAVTLTTLGCYGKHGDDGDDDVLDPGDPIDRDGDGVPDDVVLDDDPGAPNGDPDGDGLTNDVDTDDDGDGIPDDMDVDADGDGILERSPGTNAIGAAWAVAQVSCELALACCVTLPDIDDLGYGNSNADEMREACTPAAFVESLPGFAQARPRPRVTTSGGAAGQSWRLIRV